jgi:hypothetical protein
MTIGKTRAKTARGAGAGPWGERLAAGWEAMSCEPSFGVIASEAKQSRIRKNWIASSASPPRNDLD